MRISDLAADSLARTGDRIRESTRQKYLAAIEDFVQVIGNKDYQRVTPGDSESYRLLDSRSSAVLTDALGSS